MTQPQEFGLLDKVEQKLEQASLPLRLGPPLSGAFRL